jgi:uncharacterized protein YndB with AHSA1/START domain
MSSVHVTTRINAPIERVWETIMDPNRFGEWVTIHRAVREVSGDPARRGATMEQTLHVRGVTFKVHWELTDVNPPYSAEWIGRGPAHSTARIHYALSSAGDNNTVFDYTNEFTAPGGRIGSYASNVIVGHTPDREAHASIARLKALVERP